MAIPLLLAQLLLAVALAAVQAAPRLHPVVLVPGYATNELDARLTELYRPSSPCCGARKGEGWFRLYLNYSALQDPANVPCFAEQMRSVYDPAADDYSNVTGYRDGETMFGAPYDFRYAAAPLPHPGVPVTSVVGVGVGTPERIVFPGDDFDVTPFVVAGDGDGVVNLVSAVAVETSWSHGGEDFRMVKVSNMSHNALLVDDRALEIIIREIQRAD
ncbi:unnamed protein product [Triticum turgidum subsp. durum]|uniref:Lecithin-cholesterol acyltransferase-like 1 n=2 Tax=Triticum TaxID=4564 RepID=A0A9R0RBK0_TRITD|nr:unnamed protein product [Triticum turgidum subsp. durum]